VKSGSIRVIDTNILLVANKQHEGVSPDCVIACIDTLISLKETGRVVLDDAYEIVNEYRLKTAPNTGNQVGDAFLKWLLQNIGKTKCVECVHIEPHTERGYAEFPDDQELSDFDRADRKFVAVAAKHPKRPRILQAADSKWMEWSDRLSEHNISVEFLCRSDISSFLRRKRA
jgi:hypothetical protein